MSNRAFVILAGAVTLAVTLLRLTLELTGHVPHEGMEGGGGGYAIGISWLIFVFGGVMGWRLQRQGLGPGRPGRTLGLAVLITILAILPAALWFSRFEIALDAFPAVIFISSAGWITGTVLMFRLWPGLARLTLVYGVLARLPVVVITSIAVPMEWGTHYEKAGPGAGLDLSTGEALFGLNYAQVFLWIPATVVLGCTVGALLAWVASRTRRVGPPRDATLGA